MPSSLALRRSLGNPAEPWADDGELRTLSRMLHALLPHAVGFVLPHASGVLSVDRMRDALGDPDSPDDRAYRAWISCTFDGDARLYVGFGLPLQGLPDVQIECANADDATLDRALDAVLFAIHTMAWSNAPLEDGDTVELPPQCLRPGEHHVRYHAKPLVGLDESLGAVDGLPWRIALLDAAPRARDKRSK